MQHRSGPSVLLVGPYDPTCGEYTFLSPPLGVWRLEGMLKHAGYDALVFDPNCCGDDVERAFDIVLAQRQWSVIGISTTGMTLRYDLALAHRARRARPDALLVAGGMEATFDPDTALQLGPFDLIALGEGEKTLRELCDRLAAGADWHGIVGTAYRGQNGETVRLLQNALTREELRDSIMRIPYDRMPYRDYWAKLEHAYRVKELWYKAERETRLAEIRSVRLITLNYCPMNCTFCSSTNFLNAAQGSTAKLGRLEADECLTMIRRIAGAYPDMRTLIFQDDIFVLPNDRRIVPLCAGIVEAKARGELPNDLQFISTNRIDAMSPERLAAMKRAGFRVLGFGIENFSRAVLQEFNKVRIHPLIPEVLTNTLREGITPFLDMIMTSPRSTLDDLAENIRQAYAWTDAGCEVGMYPYVIPFSGAAMASDPALKPHTIYKYQRVAGTDIEWAQPSKILPIDPLVRDVILSIEETFIERLVFLEARVAHLPSRVRSLLWVACAIPVLEQAGHAMPDLDAVEDHLLGRLPGVTDDERERMRDWRHESAWRKPALV